jgi:hypothetical protein
LILISDKEVNRIFQDVQEEYEDSLFTMTIGQLATIVATRGFREQIYIEIIPAKGGIFLERSSLH